jgi:lipopolysaccharide export system protein LptC
MQVGPRRPVGVTFTRLRRSPSPRRLARRRRTIRLAKFVLPTLALVLLTALALWPQIAGDHSAARLDFHTMAQVARGDTVFGARYHGMDQQNRPYTVTAAVARRIGPDRITLRQPQGDLRMQDGGSVILEAQRGMYWRATRTLDLSRDVTLSREDGTTLITASATIDLKRGAAGGAKPVDATGPFGSLHADGGFTLLDKGADIDFIGPARLVLSGVMK